MKTHGLNVTFDVDYMDYDQGKAVNELAHCFETIQGVLEELPQLKTTWFIRLDRHIGSVLGWPDYIFTEHQTELTWLLENGHQVGWHCHPYQKNPQGEWVQQTHEQAIMEELTELAPLAHGYGLRAVRMGWGYHTSGTMHALQELGFEIDSSAVPRPNYAWELSQKDWTTTPQAPYYPSTKDYRVPADDDSEQLAMLEIPMTTTLVEAPYDEEPVIRYLNPAYHADIFQAALARIQEAHLDVVTTVTHPYEVMPREEGHGLLSFSPDTFAANLRALVTHCELPQKMEGAL